MTETGKSISEWAAATFGPVGSDIRVAVRALEEMTELLRGLSAGAPAEKMREEVADVVIVLARLSDRLGGDLWADIERKMEINRKRVWKLDGTGHGYHVREKTPETVS